VIVQGIIDCYFEETSDEDGKHIVLVDYKTNYDTAGIEEKYREQMALYKEALEKASGLPVTESYLYLFSEGRAIPAD
jgi:ATP-dependent helicase/nuclease subunit A